MQHIKLSSPMTFRASSDTARVPSRFTGTAYTGAVVPGGLVIDLSTTTVPNTMALLAEHDRTSIVGKVESSTKQGGQLIVAGALYSDMTGSKAEEIARLAARGFPFEMSVGLYDFTEQSIAPGQRLSVNGRDVAGPATVLRGGTVRECSVCTLGADAKTSMAFFSAHSPERARAIDKVFAALGQAIGPEERAAYMSMSDATFGLFAAKMRQLAGRADLSDAMRQLARQPKPIGQPKPIDLSAKSVYARRAAALKLH